MCLFLAKVLKQLQTCRKTKQRNCMEKNRKFVDTGFVIHGIVMKAKLKKNKKNIQAVFGKFWLISTYFFFQVMQRRYLRKKTWRFRE